MDTIHSQSTSQEEWASSLMKKCNFPFKLYYTVYTFLSNYTKLYYTVYIYMVSHRSCQAQRIVQDCMTHYEHLQH